MLKIFKIIILLIISFTISSVNALTPKIEYIDNVYSNRIIDGKSINGQLGYIYINNFLAFCIDPMKIIGNEYMIYTNKLDDYYTKEQQRKLKLIIHYGSGTHADNQYYYMATQELIWRLNNDGDFYFTTTSSIDGERINIEKYKEEILYNVERHDILPSFDKITITPKLYETLILKDENNVLNGYSYKSGKNTIDINGNELKIKIDYSTPTTIKLSKLYFSGSLSRTYIGNGQTLITSYFDEEQEVSINVLPTGVSYYIGVKMKEGNNLVLDKVKFKIYNHNTSNYILDGKVFETDNLGYYESDFKLDPGTYEIVYTDIPYSYISSKTPNIFTLDENTEVDGAYRHTVISYLEKPHGLLKINRGVIKYDKSIYKLDNIEYEIYASTNIYNNKLIYKKNQLVETISTIDGYAEIKLPMGKYYIIEKDNNYGIIKSDKQYVNFKYVDSTTDEYIVNKEINTPLPTFNLIIDTYKENINKTYSKYEYFKYDVIADHDIYYFGDLVYKKGDIVLRLKSDVNGYINKKFNLIPGKYIIREKTISDIYYEHDDMEINYNDINNNTLNYLVCKKLKRGNLLIKVYSELDEKIDKLTFFYDNNFKYDIIDELLLEDIKIGNYKLFYDKEYVVTIKENETTILDIKLLKENKEEPKKEEDKSKEKENNEESKTEEDKSEEKENKEETKKEEDKSEEKENKEEPKKEEDKSEEKENKEEPKKEEDKSEEKENKEEQKKEEDKSEEKENKEETKKEEDKSKEKENNEESKTEDNTEKNTKKIKHEKLPDTYNYLKQYCTLYELFIISGLIIKLYAKKDK